MVYYILLKDDTETQIQYSPNILGESSFKNFWTDTGYSILKLIIKKHPNTLNDIKIKDEKSKEYTIDEFLSIIEKLNIIEN